MPRIATVQGNYRYDDGIWWHVCDAMPRAYEVNWNDKAWVVSDTAELGCILISFCPFCGLELQPMPESENQEENAIDY